MVMGSILDWFRSYLSNRKQYVSMQDTNSSIETITCGVPQGSILGPLLFIIYINDLANVSDLLFCILFADDTSVFINGTNLPDMINTLNIELSKLSEWLSANKLSINVAKSHFMIFHRSKIKVTHPEIILCNAPLIQVHYTKFLGVIIDDELNWRRHIAYIKNKIAKGMGIILKARKFLSKKILIQLYYSFVFPYLIYCIEVWGNAPDLHLDPLIKLQKKIIRIITFSAYGAPTKNLFLNMQILPFKNLVFHRLGLQLFKFNVGDLPFALQNLFVKNSSFHNYNTRNKDKLRPAVGNHMYRYRDFSFISVHI